LEELPLDPWQTQLIQQLEKQRKQRRKKAIKARKEIDHHFAIFQRRGEKKARNLTKINTKK
jgi:hypothetical protein